MKANEIMIGDFVRVNRDGLCIKKDTIVQVRGIDGDDKIEEKGLFGAAHCRPLDGEQFDGGIWLDYLDPIPLTPEILEKNGWYRAKFDGGYGRKGIRLDGSYNELNELPEGVENALHFAQWSIDEHFEYHLLDIYMWKGSIHLWIEYVHELQHALRLCGIEKEVIL